MNKKQKLLLVLGCIFFLSVSVYPEWISKEVWHKDNFVNISSEGRHLLFSPPEDSDFYGGNEYVIASSEYIFLNTTRLFIEWTIIVIPCLVLFFVFKSKNKDLK